MARMRWDDPTPADVERIEELTGLLAAVAAAGPSPRIAGHLRVATSTGARDVLLGARTVLDGPVAILDWRTAPLAEVFFRHAPGEAYELEVDDRVVAGRVVARHQLALDAGALTAIVSDSTELRRFDDRWRARAAEPPPGPPPGVDPARAPIVLDPDQQRAIELPAGRSLVADGEAGVGKTLVALYRLAALATTAQAADRRFRPLILVPTEGLRRLCRRIADRLAIPRLEIALVDDWLIARARAAFPRLPARVGEDANARVIALKRHPAVREELARLVGWRTPRSDIKAPRVRAVLHELFGDRDRLERIVTAAGGALPAASVGDVLAHTHVQFTETTEAAHRHVDADRLIALDGRALDAGTPTGDANTFDAEDVPVLFELARRGVVTVDAAARLARYDHIVIDEAQLRSPLELAAIGDALAPDAAVTLAGDHRQDTDGSAWFAGWDAALAELGRRDAERITLAVGYRSAPAIAALARAVAEAPPAVLPAVPTHAIAATSAAGELAQVIALGRGLDALIARDPWRTIAVIARNDEHARRLARELGRATEVTLVLDGGFTFAPGIVITAAPQVSGLEFDAIVVPDLAPGYWPAVPEMSRALYVACTRARDWLWVATPGAWSPLVIDPRHDL
jgi:DNA helicase-2/ATP-dependent DNA helicase PcrA